MAKAPEAITDEPPKGLGEDAKSVVLELDDGQELELAFSVEAEILAAAAFSKYAPQPHLR